MNPKYMLDTNICIYLMKEQSPEVAARFAQCYVGEVVISAVTYAELEYGVVRSGDRQSINRTALDSLCRDIPVLAFGMAAGGAYGAIRLAAPERRRDALDRLIAAHAIAVDATLVTNNSGDFRHFPGLRLENWVSAH